MTITCKNCGNHFKGNYCYQCGQAADTHHINSHFLWHDIQHGLFHFDKGILYTARQLFRKPGATIREYIDGKRVKHLKPISMLILLATVWGLLFHLLDIDFTSSSTLRGFTDGFNSEPDDNVPKIDPAAINAWIGNHYALISLIQLPFFALGSWLAFRKSGYNYVEHLVMNAYLSAQRLIVHIALLPLQYYYNRTEVLLYISTGISIIDLGLLLWGYTTFFHRYSTGKAIALSLLSYVLVGVLAILTAFVVVVIAALVHKHLPGH